MKKERLYIFDENNRFMRVLVGPSEVEKEMYPNSLLNPNTKHLKKFPMERWEKSGKDIVVKDKQSITTQNIARRIEMSDVVKEVELQLKQVLNAVKNQNLDLEAYKKENEKLKKRFSYGKLFAFSVSINLICGAAIVYYLNYLQ